MSYFQAGAPPHCRRQARSSRSAPRGRWRSQSHELPLLLLPLTVPVLIAAIESTAILLSGRPISEAGLWFRLLAGFDIIFTVLCWLLFGYVIEE